MSCLTMFFFNTVNVCFLLANTTLNSSHDVPVCKKKKKQNRCS